MRNIVITFGIICFCSLILLQMGKVALVKNTIPVEVIIGTFALVFFMAGILIARRPVKSTANDLQTPLPIPTPAVPEAPQSTNAINYQKVNELGISKREHEILREVALGLSNTEIAQKLFVSESTVKTHISNLLLKLGAKRRTEAVRLAKDLSII